MPELEWLKNNINQSHIPDIVRKTGLSDPTIRAIGSGKNDNPRLKTLQALSVYFESKMDEGEA